MEKILNEMIEFFVSQGQQGWASFLNHLVNQFNSIEDKRDAASLVMRNLFGGMGSLNDLVMQKEGKILIKENDKLDLLRNRLYKKGVELRTGDAPPSLWRNDVAKL
jgi:hypothetical protein